MSKRKPSRRGAPQQTPQGAKNLQGQGKSGRAPWLFGRHAVLAALTNPNRRCQRLLIAAKSDSLESEALEACESAGVPRPRPEIVDRRAIDDILPRDAVHQGIALMAEPLEEMHLEDVLFRLEGRKTARVAVLDQATDPRNIGAVLRSAAAFGVEAVIVQDRHAPEATGVLAKAASGALERVSLIHATNLARALDDLKQANFWTVGLDGQANQMLGEIDLSGRIALVLGSEGAGLRRLVREHCDHLAKIPISGAMESLNLSNAAAVAFYEAARSDTPDTQP